MDFGICGAGGFWNPPDTEGRLYMKLTPQSLAHRKHSVNISSTSYLTSISIPFPHLLFEVVPSIIHYFCIFLFSLYLHLNVLKTYSYKTHVFYCPVPLLQDKSLDIIIWNTSTSSMPLCPVPYPRALPCQSMQVPLIWPSKWWIQRILFSLFLLDLSDICQ